LPADLQETLNAGPSDEFPSPDSEKPAYRILVAEDTDANYEIVEIFLTKAGYIVNRAVNGRFAVDGAAGADLILMDIEMPEMDGLEATRCIRENEKRLGLPSVPILALTAHAVQGSRERCFEAGCSDYLTKPIRMEELITILQTSLEPPCEKVPPCNSRTE
jgi:CheY-like chemotaxis protein